MRTTLAILLLSACSLSPDPHEVMPCDWTAVPGYENYTGQCEAACVTPPVTTPMQCSATDSSISGFRTRECYATFDWNGQVGCCDLEKVAGPIDFYECDQ